MADWSKLFVGREAELERLKEAYTEAAAGKTRVVSIIAESGFGKTRLVQEFYHWISTHHDGAGSKGYWPDRLLKREDNLMVNPDLGETGSSDTPMPFLWWGLRLHDPDARNEIVSRALWAGLDILKAHLERHALSMSREEWQSRAHKAVLKLVLDLAVDTAGSIASFGLLGPAKTVFENTSAFYDLARERNRIDQLDASPGAADQKANDELIQTILADLARLSKSPPKGFRPIPLVIVLDDAQWLPHDDGTSAFAQALVRRARLENWPLLLILTSWEREWKASERSGEVPASLFVAEDGDLALYMDKTPELVEVVKTAFPGLNETQRTKILEQVDGNPRFLDELLMYLARNPKYFVDRDLSLSLTDRGVEEVIRREFPDFVADRFAEAPEYVRRAMSLASLQGNAFSPRLVNFMAEQLALESTFEGLSEGADPHGFARLEPARGEGEFRLRAYRNAACDDLGNHVDEGAAQAALDAACAETLNDLAAATERDLVLVLERAEWAGAITASAELIKRANERHDARAAGSAAAAVLPLVFKHIDQGDLIQLGSILEAQWEWAGPSRELLMMFKALVDRSRVELASRPSLTTTAALREGLERLAIAVETFDGPAVARPLREEVTAICRSLVEEQPTPGTRSDLSCALGWLGTTVEALDGPAAARPLVEEMVAICRAQVDEQPTFSVRDDLAVALFLLGDTVEALDGPAAARPLREEMTAIYRALVEEQPTFSSRRNLAVALGCLGKTVEALDSPAAARPLVEEMVAICRALVDEQPTFKVRLDLAVALGCLGDTVEALDGPAAARPLREEMTAIYSALVEERPTFSARSNLASALSHLGNTVEALDGPAAAQPLREEMTAISRALVEERPTFRARRHLAVALGCLGNTVETLDGPAAALPLREEMVAICRSLVEEQPTFSARLDLAVALGCLGDTVEALDGPAAARPLVEEMTAIYRALFEEQPTFSARSNLAGALSHLGNTVEALDGPAVAQPLREEMTAICRALVEERPTFSARSNLARALSHLGNTVEALDGPAAAQPLREEMTAICRALVEEQPTFSARRDLAVSLGWLGTTVEALDGPAAARPLVEEMVAICRALVEEQPTFSARSSLAGALSRLGNTVKALDGPAAARPLREEMVAICRALVEEQPTFSSRRDLAVALGCLGNTVEALDGPAAARPLMEEAIAISRALVAEQPTFSARSDLAGALSRLGQTVEALDGPAAARPFREEAATIYAVLQSEGCAAPGQELDRLCNERDLLKGSLLGKNPWYRAFANETLDPELSNNHEARFQALAADYRIWAATAGQAQSLGLVETILYQVARCRLATGDYRGAAEISDKNIPSLSRLAEIVSANFGALASNLILSARAHEQLGDIDIARRLYFEAFETQRKGMKYGRALDYRQHAVAAWFLAEHLERQGKLELIAPVLDEGYKAAKRFATFKMQDGAAILAAYDQKTTSKLARA